LVFTGARRSEILKARWEFVDLKHRQLAVPRAKSGRRRYISLSDRSVEVLEKLPREAGQALLFPSARRPEQALSGLRNAWARAKAAAGLPAELRIHDLRHTFASLLINSGVHLYDVGRLLGHSQLSTTARYAHLSNERQLEAVNAVGKMATLSGGAE
jgi:integrase